MSRPDGEPGSSVLREDMRGEPAVREEVLDVLLEKIRTDRYPSSTMMRFTLGNSSSTE